MISIRHWTWKLRVWHGWIFLPKVQNFVRVEPFESLRRKSVLSKFSLDFIISIVDFADLLKRCETWITVVFHSLEWGVTISTQSWLYYSKQVPSKLSLKSFSLDRLRGRCYLSISVTKNIFNCGCLSYIVIVENYSNQCAHDLIQSLFVSSNLRKLSRIMRD